MMTSFTNTYSWAEPLSWFLSVPNLVVSQYSLMLTERRHQHFRGEQEALKNPPSGGGAVWGKQRWWRHRKNGNEILSHRQTHEPHQDRQSQDRRHQSSRLIDCNCPSTSSSCDWHCRDERAFCWCRRRFDTLCSKEWQCAIQGLRINRFPINDQHPWLSRAKTPPIMSWHGLKFQGSLTIPTRSFCNQPGCLFYFFHRQWCFYSKLFQQALQPGVQNCWTRWDCKGDLDHQRRLERWIAF